MNLRLGQLFRRAGAGFNRFDVATTPIVGKRNVNGAAFLGPGHVLVECTLNIPRVRSGHHPCGRGGNWAPDTLDVGKQFGFDKLYRLFSISC